MNPTTKAPAAKAIAAPIHRAKSVADIPIFQGPILVVCYHVGLSRTKGAIRPRVMSAPTKAVEGKPQMMTDHFKPAGPSGHRREAEAARRPCIAENERERPVRRKAAKVGQRS